MFKILFFSGRGLKDSRVDERHEKHKEQKKNIDQLVFIKINNFCPSKDATKRVKRQPTEWRKYSESYI